MRFDDNGGGRQTMSPTAFGPVEDPRFLEPPLTISGWDRYDHHEGNDDYTGDLFRLMRWRGRLIANIVAHMASVPRDIQLRQIEHFRKADPDYGNVWPRASASPRRSRQARRRRPSAISGPMDDPRQPNE